MKPQKKADAQGKCKHEHGAFGNPDGTCVDCGKNIKQENIRKVKADAKGLLGGKKGSETPINSRTHSLDVSEKPAKPAYGSADLLIAGACAKKAKDGFPIRLIIVDAETHKEVAYYEKSVTEKPAFPLCEKYGLKTLADLEAGKVEQALSRLEAENSKLKRLLEMAD